MFDRWGAGASKNVGESASFCECFMKLHSTLDSTTLNFFQVYIGLFPTRADAAATLARVLYQNLGLEGDPTQDIKVIVTTRDHRLSFAFVR